MKLFGTDGIRGLTNTYPIDPKTMQKIAIAAGLSSISGSYRHLVVIGKDTRLSGYMIESAIISGLVSIGMDVRLVGPLPTPGVALLTRSLRADLGIVISASHNPYCDNGVKFFGPDGYKISQEKEALIESLIESKTIFAKPKDIGQVKRIDDAQGRYIEFVKSAFPKHLNLCGMKIVVDAANGAAYKIAHNVFWELGAEVISLNDKPDGLNINKHCGSIYPMSMCRAVIDHQADIGIALDGDADRVVIANKNGSLIPGEYVLAMILLYMKQTGNLHGNGLVTTVMANLGFVQYIKNLGLSALQTPVGDRFVTDTMRINGMNLGGEPSGHIMLNDYTTTGDGLIATLHLLAFIISNSFDINNIQLFNMVPSINVDIRVSDKSIINTSNLVKTIERAKVRLGENGSLVVRASGTEPVIRISAQSEDESLLREIIQEISDKVAKLNLRV